MGSRAGAGIAVLFMLGMGACTGSGHQLPSISESERLEAIKAIEAAPPINPTTRTLAENEKIARGVVSKLQTATGALCAKEGRNCWFTFELKSGGEPNAYISNNQLVMTNGMAQYLQTEDEFAAIIGHEMAHYISAHQEERLQNQAAGALVAGLIFGALAGASGAYQYNPYQAQADMQNAMNIGAAIGQISYSKEQEAEADYLSSYILTRGGYNPVAAQQIWIKLAKMSGQTDKASLFDSHPSSPERLVAWEKSIEEVRYSADLLPNLKDAEPEARLQTARVLDDQINPENAEPETEPGIALAAVEHSTTTETAAAFAGNAPQQLNQPIARSDSQTFVRVNWEGVAYSIPGVAQITNTDDANGLVSVSMDTMGISCAGYWIRGRVDSSAETGDWELECSNGKAMSLKYLIQSDGEGRASGSDSLSNSVRFFIGGQVGETS